MRRTRQPTLIGWREWVGLPELGVQMLKAKIDTGARSSALHAWDIRPFDRDGCEWIAFQLHPMQRDNHVIVDCEARVVGERRIRSSSGTLETRYAIETLMAFGDARRRIEVTLTNRDEMGFRLLLGRTALRRRAIIDPSRSFLITRRLSQ